MKEETMYAGFAIGVLGAIASEKSDVYRARQRSKCNAGGGKQYEQGNYLEFPPGNSKHDLDHIYSASFWLSYAPEFPKNSAPVFPLPQNSKFHFNSTQEIHAQ